MMDARFSHLLWVALVSPIAYACVGILKLVELIREHPGKALMIGAGAFLAWLVLL
jgi:hypothetical protein